MDIHTLNAVIEKLQSRVDRAQHMLEWSIRENQEARGVDMWCDAKVEAKECLEMVQVMLNEELAFRAEEAA